MIPKNELISGSMYKGTSRNASNAVWNGYKFIYIQTEWYGDEYMVFISHPDDEDNYDVFVPLELESTLNIIPKSELEDATWYKGYGQVAEMMWFKDSFFYDFGNVEYEATHIHDGLQFSFIPIVKL